MFLLTTKNAFLTVKRVYSMNTYEFQWSHEGVSEVSEQACEWSEQASKPSGAKQAEQSGVLQNE